MSTSCPDLTNKITRSGKFSVFQGGFSDVYEGILNDGTPAGKRVAIKVLRCAVVDSDDTPRDILNRRVRRESTLWYSLEHRNVLPFYGLSLDKSMGDFPSLVSMFCAQGCVVDYLKKNPTANRLQLIIGVANGLEYLHSKDILHGDLKGHNILINDDGVPLLCDFGRARWLGRKGYTTSLTGSWRFLAPEIMKEDPPPPNPSKDEPSDQLSTKSSDVYSFGLTALEIWSGALPFPRIVADIVAVTQIIGGKKPQQAEYPNMPPQLWSLLDQCWSHQPDSRPVIASYNTITTHS